MHSRAAERSALVTGANGFVGSRIARRLVMDGWRVRAIVRSHDPSPDLIGVEQVVGDFVEPPVSRAAGNGMRTVIHCAATGGPDREAAERVNVAGTRSMLDAAIQNRCDRYIQISTCSVYQTAGLLIVDEEAPLQGTDAEPYGATKADADRAVLKARDGGLHTTIFRPGAILGVHPTSTWAVQVPDRIRTEAGFTRPRTRSMAWVHVEDLVDGVMLALSSDAAGRVYNMVDEHTTWGDYADRVRSWLGLEPQPEVDPATPSAGWTGRFEARRVRDELGYAPQRTYEQGMNEAEQYWRARLVTTGSV
jgi:2-alkyl-3-oxoalkanoate reductase